MAVKINMEMPKSCIECRFCRWNDYKCKWSCTASVPVISMASSRYYNERKMKKCPLQEVKE